MGPPGSQYRIITREKTILFFADGPIGLMQAYCRKLEGHYAYPQDGHLRNVIPIVIGHFSGFINLDGNLSELNNKFIDGN